VPVHEALLAEIYQVQSAIGQMTGYAEVIRRRTLDRSAVFGQRDVKLSRSPLQGHCY
jgi:hypothetical protein